MNTRFLLGAFLLFFAQSISAGKLSLYIDKENATKYIKKQFATVSFTKRPYSTYSSHSMFQLDETIPEEYGSTGISEGIISVVWSKDPQKAELKSVNSTQRGGLMPIKTGSLPTYPVSFYLFHLKEECVVLSLATYTTKHDPSRKIISHFIEVNSFEDL